MVEVETNVEEVKEKTLAEQLQGFFGTGSYHKFNMFFAFVCTDGVAYLADKGGAFWLLDEIAIMSVQLGRGKEGQEPVFFTVTSKNNKAKIVADDGDGNTLKKKNISFTDLPTGEYKVWVMDGVLLLPSEY